MSPSRSIPALLHNPPGSDIAHVGCRPNSLKREILEPERKNAPQGFGGKSLPPMIWMHRIAEVALPMFRRADADAYGADEPWLFPDLDGKEPISLRIWLTVGNGLFDELGSAFHRLWRQRQKADEFWPHRIGGNCFDIGGLEGP